MENTESRQSYGIIGGIETKLSTTGTKVTVTHRNPMTGEVWCESDSFEDGGMWVSGDLVNLS